MLDLLAPPASESPLPHRRWPAEAFLAALHPAGGAGRVSTLSLDGGRVCARTWRIPEHAAVAGALSERQS